MPTADTARAQRFATYVDHLAPALGHRDRHEPLRAYLTGLCLPGARKSIEPMAARIDPRVHAQDEVFEYIEGFYNGRRRHSALGYLSPVIFERPWATAPPRPADTVGRERNLRSRLR